MSNEALIIFIKNPVLGKVKTRLAVDVGEEKALEIYKVLLNHLRELSNTLEMDKFLYYSDYIDKDDEWSAQKYRKHLQAGGGLGKRMEKAFSEVFQKGYKKVVLIGSDIYGLKSTVIIRSFRSLDVSDVVIGPAEDGGYYLIGMKQLIKSPFTLDSWSHPGVLNDTKGKLDEEHYTIELLEQLRDIDTKSDLMGTSLEALL